MADRLSLKNLPKVKVMKVNVHCHGCCLFNICIYRPEIALGLEVVNFEYPNGSKLKHQTFFVVHSKAGHLPWAKSGYSGFVSPSESPQA